MITHIRALETVIANKPNLNVYRPVQGQMLALAC